MLRLQAILNFSVSTATKKLANKIIYGFRPNQLLDLALASAILELNPAIARISATNALVHVSISAKYYYDKYYKPLFLKEG